MGTLIGSTFRDALCAEFNNGVSNEYAYVDAPSFGADTQGSFAIWYRPRVVLTSEAFRGLISYGVNGASNAQLTIAQRWNTSAAINATYRSQPIPDVIHRATNGGTVNRAYGNHIFNAAAWVHWVCQSNGTAWEHWINGSSVGATAWSGANTGDWLGDVSGGQRLVFGSQWVNNAGAYHSDARVNECQYFNRPLTSGEVSWLYNGGAPRNPHRGGFGTDLKSWWRFGDSRDSATTIYDEIGSNHLTLVNMDASNYVAP